MIVFDKIRKIFNTLFVRKNKSGATQQEISVRPDIYFRSIAVMNKTPDDSTIAKRDFVTVIYKGKPFWSLFRCPCGCNTMISLSLQKIHNPNWMVVETQEGRPTVNPSIRQIKGCFSHFWIEDGRVHWCSDTGLPVEPEGPNCTYGVAVPSHSQSQKI